MRYPDRGLYGTVGGQRQESARQRQHRAWMILNDTKFSALRPSTLESLPKMGGGIDRPTHIIITHRGEIIEGVM
jgi:hypothetical protein